MVWDRGANHSPGPDSASLIDVQAVYENTKKSMEELETLHQEVMKTLQSIEELETLHQEVMKTHQSIIDDCERVLHREQQ